jgi:hypothetical protein
MILVERAARIAAEAERDHSRSSASSADALIAYLRLEIEKLRRTLYGVRSERQRRLLDQLELSWRTPKPRQRKTSWRRGARRVRAWSRSSSASDRRESHSPRIYRASAS